MMTEEQSKDIEFVRGSLIKKIADLVASSTKLKELPEEVTITIIYLKIFASYLQEQKFNNLEEAWKLMTDTKGIIEKIFYADHYVFRAIESMEKSKVSAK